MPKQKKTVEAVYRRMKASYAAGVKAAQAKDAVRRAAATKAARMMARFASKAERLAAAGKIKEARAALATADAWKSKLKAIQ